MPNRNRRKIKLARPTTLSGQLDQARAMEELHRDQLLWWKRRRQWLEGQVPVCDPFEEFIRELKD